MRRAWRSAQRLGTDLDLLWVKPPGKPIEGEEERQVTALRQLASVLGATLLIEEHDDVVAAVARVVRERGSTYIMVGESLPPRGLARLRTPLPQKLMRATPPGVDVRIVAHRGQQGGGVVIEHFLVGLALLLGLGGGYLLARSRWRGKRSERPEDVRQILLPFTGTEISRRAVDAALRLARAEDATLMPAYLAAVPKQLPLECAIPAEAAKAMPMLEAIEQRATAQGVPVDARIERGRSYRHALAAAAGARGVRPGRRLGDRDRQRRPLRRRLVWLLEKAPAEVLILRPGPEDRRVVSVSDPSADGKRTPRPPGRKLPRPAAPLPPG